jgi:hypothetical protein
LVETLELLFYPLDPPPRCGALLLVEIQRFCPGKPPMSALQNRRCHIQVAHHFGARFGWCRLLPLRFEKQLGIVENALPDRGRCLPPCGIELPR